MAVETTRGDILHLVAGGAMTPEDAEAEALRLGFEPFEIRPDPSQWDPMGEVVWTLPMALAWIIWRSRKMVRHMWDSYRKRFRCWHFQRFDLGDWGTREGHELIEGGPAQLSHIMAAIKRVPPASSEIKCVEDAVRLLRLAAQRGAFTARAVTPDGGRPRDIPPAEWSHLDVIDLGGTTVLRFPSRGFPDAGYDMVTIPRKDFIGNFRPLAARQGQACHPADAGMAIDVSRTTKLDAVREAAKAVYPHGLPSGLTIKERNKALGDYIQNAGGTRPSDRTFRRALKQRADTGQ